MEDGAGPLGGAGRSGHGSALGATMRAFDAHRRKTLDGAGGGSGVVDAATYFGASAYDGANNLTGVGLPYNAPPAWRGCERY